MVRIQKLVFFRVLESFNSYPNPQNSYTPTVFPFPGQQLSVLALQQVNEWQEQNILARLTLLVNTSRADGDLCGLTERL